MSHQPSKKGTIPFSLRFTPEERRRLERAAGGQPLGTYIRGKILSDDAGDTSPRRTSSKPPIRDHAALAKVLAFLGHTHFAPSLMDLAQAAKAGTLPVTPETEEFLQEACKAVIETKDVLMRALGFRER